MQSDADINFKQTVSQWHVGGTFEIMLFVVLQPGAVLNIFGVETS